VSVCKACGVCIMEPSPLFWGMKPRPRNCCCLANNTRLVSPSRAAKWNAETNLSMVVKRKPQRRIEEYRYSSMHSQTRFQTKVTRFTLRPLYLGAKSHNQTYAQNRKLDWSQCQFESGGKRKQDPKLYSVEYKEIPKVFFRQHHGRWRQSLIITARRNYGHIFLLPGRTNKGRCDNFWP
jgi:hypothetical protein